MATSPSAARPSIGCEVGGGAYGFEYPASGGNPDGYGIIHHTNGWTIWVNGKADPGLPLEVPGAGGREHLHLCAGHENTRRDQHRRP